MKAQRYSQITGGAGRRVFVAALAAAMVLVAIPAVGLAGDATVVPAARAPLVLTSAGLVLFGLVLLGVRRAETQKSAFQKLRGALGVALMALGFFGGLYGLTEAPPGGQTVDWVTSYEEGRQIAEATDRPLMIDFTADWCTACQELEAEVFSHPEVRPRLEDEFVAVKIDYDDQVDSEDAAYAVSRFQVVGLPRVAFETVDGTFLEGPSFDGKVDVDEFHLRLDRALAGEEEEGGGWVETTLGERGWWVLLLLVFGAGVLASLTPCVYPLIPITIGVLGAREASTRREGFLLSLSYVGGIVATYSVLGVVAASVGGVFGGFLQNLWLQAAIALLFVVLALGCLGVYSFQLPEGLQKRLHEVGGAGHGGAFAMGLVAGLIAAPCVGPVVAGILLYVAEQGDLVLGWLLLTVFAVGMGLLFLVLGTFSSLLHRLPRSGGWMEAVKMVFGAVFLGLALYYLRLAVPAIGDGMDWFWLVIG